MTYILLLAAAILTSVPAGIAGTDSGTPPGAEGPRPIPARLSETGLYVEGSRTVQAGIVAYAPQYPLWSDNAYKKRWLFLPPGASIDASDPDAWVFPPGSRFWKEFGYAEPVETRMIERLVDGSWRYAAYVWDSDLNDAVLAPDGGYNRHPTKVAPAGFYTIPSRDDCRACHEGGAVPILGISTLQLSPDRDPLAPNTVPALPAELNLNSMVEQGLVVNLPKRFLSDAPRINVRSQIARAVLGYLHANCGHCHNDSGPLADLELVLAQTLSSGAADPNTVLQSIIDVPSEFHLYGATTRVVPGDPSRSVLALRMRSRNPIAQMPPLGTRAADVEALLLIERWIMEELKPTRSDSDDEL